MATITCTGVYRRAMGATPEIYVSKQIDNSRLVKMADPARSREMRYLMASLAMLLAMVMVYAWQHLSAIEYGYSNEKLRTTQEELLEANRQLKLEEASLQEPARIDELARKMGMQAPVAGQVVRMDPGESGEPSGPVMARVAAVSVISPVQ
jgi:cell division protein FtsL